MKVNELMIGDWVYNTHHKKNIQITAYDFFTHHHNNDGTQSFLGIIEPKTTRGFDLKPIPLTEEILKANGFIHRYNGYGYDFYIHNKKDYAGEFSLYQCFDGKGSEVVGYGLKMNGRIAGIDFVHQLQHALRLCGLNELADNFKIKAMEGKV